MFDVVGIGYSMPAAEGTGNIYAGGTGSNGQHLEEVGHMRVDHINGDDVDRRALFDAAGTGYHELAGNEHCVLKSTGCTDFGSTGYMSEHSVKFGD